MAEHDDGGPAFPLHGIDGPTWDGMTLLDWFAGQALIGILSARNGFLVDVGTDNAARALQRTILANYWRFNEPGVKSLRVALARCAPGKTSIERIAYLLVCARAGGVDVLEAVRIAQHRMDELELEASVPVQPTTRPTPVLRFPLMDTGRNAKED